MNIIEMKANEATKCKAFRGIDIFLIKDAVTELLSLFGRSEIFDEYTKHDISHINEMLNLCEWIIPQSTLEKMTLSDYLMLTLAIYFHDLGLLVTRHEYNNRDTNAKYSDFIKDVKEKKYGSVLFKEERKDEESSQRFLYQEFVRKNHAERIKHWIFPEEVQTADNVFYDNKVIEEIQKLLSNLPDSFRMDLGMVCESHHLNDLDDLDKYKVESRYGQDEQECLNLQYTAIILRTADLLHITHDRTPSIQFNVINPENTISILEWQKQAAVNAIKPLSKRNEDGEIDCSLQPDTIEVTAYFNGEDRAEAYFGLMYYLQYTKEQLEKNVQFVEKAQKLEGKSDYIFPWKYIESNKKVTTIGFEKKKFQFKMNQENILKLLIGHTLYNDSSVVLRELVQNSIDAIKLLDTINRKKQNGKIEIEWNSDRRELTVTDNGTGMSIDDIEQYFLKVGISKYRTEEFKKEFPDFSPISRFGIGALTCFMIADNIDIISLKLDENKVNLISLRDVNNQYLLKILDRADPNVPTLMKQSGTQIKLYIRDGVEIGDISKILEKWIMFPYCEVALIIDGEEHTVGFETPKKALEQYLSEKGINDKYKVIEKTKNGVTLAYAIYLLPYYKDWRFVESLDNDSNRNSTSFNPSSLCIDGIRVESNSPGYETKSILSVANVSGKEKADTNVARSAVEDNSRQNRMFSNIYELYCEHISEQMDYLISVGFSRYKSIQEAGFLTRPLLEESGSDNRVARNKELLYLELENLLSIILIDKDGKEKVTCIKDLKKTKKIRIIHSKIFEAVQQMMEEKMTDTSISDLFNTLDTNIELDDSEILFCNYSSRNILHRTALSGKEPEMIRINRSMRWIDLQYSNNGTDIWSSYMVLEEERFYPGRIRGQRSEKVYIPKGNYTIENLEENEIGVIAHGSIYLSSGNKTTGYIQNQLDIIKEQSANSQLLCELFVTLFFGNSLMNINDRERLEYYIEKSFGSQLKLDSLWEIIDEEEFTKEMSANKYDLYDIYNWNIGSSN